MDYTVTKNNIHITDSAFVEKALFVPVLTTIRNTHHDCDVFKRRMCSLKFEWATHNALYALGYKRERTKDVDLDYPQPWYYTAAYCVFGALVWLFIN